MAGWLVGWLVGWLAGWKDGWMCICKKAVFWEAGEGRCWGDGGMNGTKREKCRKQKCVLWKEKGCAGEGTEAPNSELLVLSTRGLSCSLEQVRRREGKTGHREGRELLGIDPVTHLVILWETSLRQCLSVNLLSVLNRKISSQASFCYWYLGVGRAW